MFKQVLVAFDLAHTEHGLTILKRARQLCDSDGQLTMIYVGEEIPGYMEYAIPQDVIDESLEDARTKLKTVAVSNDIEANVIVSRGRPHVKILECAEELKTDLILVASHRPGIQDFLIGSTAARVVRHSQCSVLVDRS